MAKKKNQNDEEPIELVANYDQSTEVVTDRDSLEENEITLTQYEIEKRIIVIRGEQVIIDQDVAQLYNVTTKRLNQQVNRNLARFPDSFRFILTKEECNEVVANCDHLKSLKFRPTLPYAFTEQGIAQLSAVLHSQKAIETSIKIMNFLKTLY